MKSKKRILIVTTNFPPSKSIGTQRLLKICKFLNKSDWEIYMSLSSTFIAKFLTLKDTEDSQSPPACLTQTALQNEPLLLANQFRLD